MSKLVMQYGKSNLAKQSVDGIRLIERGEVTDGTTITLEFDSDSFYLLGTKEFNVSTAAYRGSRMHFISTTEEELFGTGSLAHITLGESNNSGITITYTNTGIVTLQRSSSSYGFRYFLYKL